MNIILRFLLRNIREKKLRSFLVVFAIAIAVSLYFATSALGTNLEIMFTEMYTSSTGSAQIQIRAGSDSPSLFFRTDRLKNIENEFEYTVGTFNNISGVYRENDEEQNLGIMAINYEDMTKIFRLQFYQSIDMKYFHGRSVILGKKFALENGYKCRDIIKLDIGGNIVRLVVAAIAENTGPFRTRGDQYFAIIPLDLASKFYNALGRVSIAYVKVRKTRNIQNVMNEIKELYPRYIVEFTAPEDQIKMWSANITVPYKAMLVLVLATCAFIIYTSFQVITRERLPVIGTFRSIGATRRATSWLFYAESLIYGIAGGIIGIFLGILFLKILANSTISQMYPGEGFVSGFRVTHILYSMLVGILISLVSSIIPIHSIRKYSTKDIILNNVRYKETRIIYKLILAAALLVIALIVPKFVPVSFALPADILCLIIAVFSLLQWAPVITDIFTRVLSGPFRIMFGNIGILAVKNLKANKKMHNNIALLTIGIASLLMVTTISQSIMTEIIQLYNKADFDLYAWISPMDRSLESRVRSIDGVEGTLGIYEVYWTEIKDTNKRIISIAGIDIKKYVDYWKYNIKPEQLGMLDDGRYIILGNGLKNQLKAKTGDILPLVFNSRTVNYKVIGFFSTMWNNGRTSLVSDKYLKLDSGVERYNALYVKTSGNPDTVMETINEHFSRSWRWLRTLNTLQDQDKESNSQMMDMLTGFSIMALIIGIIGVFNNFLLAFIDRRKDLALFRSQGMSKKQMIKMILVEAFAEGLLGALTGLIGGFLMLVIIPDLLTAMNLYLPLHLSLGLCLSFIIIGTLITLTAAVSPAFKSSKMNTIAALKYE